MLGRSVGIIATCALSAAALIIPPGVAPTGDNEAAGLSASLVNPKKQLVSIPCAECAFSTKLSQIKSDNDGLWMIQGGLNALLLDLSISDDGHVLLLDGQPIFPIFATEEKSLIDAKPFHVKQFPAESDLADVAAGKVVYADLRVTAYGVRSSNERPLSPSGDLLISVTLDIKGIENIFMGLPAVEIKLLQTSEGELLIVEAIVDARASLPYEKVDFPPPPPESDEVPDGPDAIHSRPLVGPFDDEDFPPPPPSPGRPDHFHQKECNMLPTPLCKLRNVIEAKVNEAMRDGRGARKMGAPCPGRMGRPSNVMPGHIKPHLDRPDRDGPARHHQGRPHHMRPHGPHHDDNTHFFRPHFFHIFAKGAVSVLIPILAGITVGMTISLVGLIVARLIGFLWVKFARRGRRGSANAVTEELLVEEGENQGMLAEMEAPPVYENAPAYEELAEKDEK